MTPRFCENCGAPLAQGVNFCEACGHPVEAPLVQAEKHLQTSAQQPYDGEGKSLAEPPVKTGKSVPLLWVAIIAGIILLVVGAVVLIPMLNPTPTPPDTKIPTPMPTNIRTPIAKITTSTPTPINSSVIINSDNPIALTLSNGMEFIKIPAGEFDMGSPIGENVWNDDEGPVHRVKILKAFYMGKYEVTQKQWIDVMGTNPSFYKGDNLPVETVLWIEAQEFIKKLNEKEGTNKYRLPSEAEWEYAARAGTTSRYSFGDDESKLGDYAWYVANSGETTHEIGQKKPNPWGLYDIHGNVQELVQDISHSNYTGAPSDGSAWENGDGSLRVWRGSGWWNYAEYCRSAIRGSVDPGKRSIVGFRLVRDL